MMDPIQINQILNENKVRRRLGLILMIPLLGGMAALFVLSTEWKQALSVQWISVNGAQTISVREIVALANLPMKTALYRLDLYDVQQRIMAQPFVKSAGAHRWLPGTVAIDIVEREPIASINVGQWRLVDGEAVVLPNIESQKKFDVPVIIGIDGLRADRVGLPIMNKELFKAIEVLKQAMTLDTVVYHMISEIDMKNGGDIVINSSDGGVPVILGREDIAKKLLMFETFWSQFVNTGEAEKLKYVDLRYEDQVVVRWNQPQESQPKKLSL